jgi:hypothetical protein
MSHIRSAEGLFFEYDSAYDPELPVFPDNFEWIGECGG